MRKFQITSSKYTGTADLFFNRDEVLFMIDCSDTDMNAETVKSFKAAVPATIAGLIDFANQPSISKIVEVGYRIDFKEFWNAYKKKINPQRCKPIYDKLNDAETIECLSGIKSYDSFLLSLNGVRQKLDPENYLRNKAWHNQWK